MCFFLCVARAPPCFYIIPDSLTDLHWQIYVTYVRGGRVFCDGVDKELLGVPVEQGRQIYTDSEDGERVLANWHNCQERVDHSTLFFTERSKKNMRCTSVDSHDCIGKFAVSRLEIHPVLVISSCHATTRNKKNKSFSILTTGTVFRKT